MEGLCKMDILRMIDSIRVQLDTVGSPSLTTEQIEGAEIIFRREAGKVFKGKDPTRRLLSNKVPTLAKEIYDYCSNFFESRFAASILCNTNLTGMGLNMGQIWYLYRNKVGNNITIAEKINKPHGGIGVLINSTATALLLPTWTDIDRVSLRGLRASKIGPFHIIGLDILTKVP